MKHRRFFVLSAVFIILQLSGTQKMGQTPLMRGILSGRVVDDAGNAVPNARIELVGLSTDGNLSTDAQGRFNAADLPIGEYLIKVGLSATDLAHEERAIVHLGEETKITISLNRKQSTDFLGSLVNGPSIQLDNLGRVVEQYTMIEDRVFGMGYEYDENGRLSSSVDNIGVRWQYEYTPSGKISRATRGDDYSVKFNYDSKGFLWKVDLPLGYKIIYVRDGNTIIKRVNRFPNITLFEFVYALDSAGNKIEVGEGGSSKHHLRYSYDGDSLVEIRDLETGEKKAFEGGIQGSGLGIVARSGSGLFEYGAEGEILRAKSADNRVEVVKEYNSMGSIAREFYSFLSKPVLTAEYLYDDLGHLAMKSFSNGFRYYYFRDKNGHVTHKIMRDVTTGKEIDYISFEPFLSEFDPDGFELLDNGKSVRLLVRDYEGRARYFVDLQGIFKYKSRLFRRSVSSDGRYWGSTEHVLDAMGEALTHPDSMVGEDLYRLSDLPIVNSGQVGEETLLSESAMPGDPCCYKTGWYCPVNCSICIECIDDGGSGGGDPGGGGGGGGSGPTYDCQADIGGPGQVTVDTPSSYSLITNCNSPYGITWTGGMGTNTGTTSFSTYWPEAGTGNVSVSFSSSAWIEFPPGSQNFYMLVTSKSISMEVEVRAQPGTEADIQVVAYPNVVSPGGQTQITVSVYDHNGDPMPDVPVTLTAAGVNGSGGHQHQNPTRRAGVLSITNGVTNEVGRLVCVYFASDISGYERIAAGTPNLSKAADVFIRVAGLVAMPQGSNYSLVGQTTAHPSNHWGLSSTTSNLIAIANAYRAEFPTAPPLVFNDMSLIYGGLFDILSNWWPPHQAHKQGQNCDLNFQTVPAGNLERLEEIIQTIGNADIIKEAQCWHLTF